MTVTNEQIEQAFEQTYTTVAAASPIPLDWEEASTRPVPLSQPAKAGPLRRPLVVFASAAALIIVAVAVVALGPARTTVLEAGGPDEWRALLFLAGDVSQDQIDSITATLQDIDGVSRWVHVDQNAALDEALAIFADDERQVAIILEDPYIIPASIRFATIDETSARAVVRMAADLVNGGETAIAEAVVSRGALVATGPQDVSEENTPQGDFVTTTIAPSP